MRFLPNMTLAIKKMLRRLPPGVVLGHLNRGIIPTVTLGRRRLVNVVALQRELGRKEFAL
jgi:hypothetical protein